MSLATPLATRTMLTFILLHAYYKKSQKALTREIEAAQRRLADLLERERERR